ncbi:TetR family transcriptional regulator [Chitinimonas sp. BJYL2]|uniref:TetR family transcriptional regulator n=1 Tax=Chitinimonas sp. BJYL2 TaxID=2976696 RepID=UPI0022B2FCBE|nr:TetR family transcriptional regulator [Chitinimonas sp. BJYL2]
MTQRALALEDKAARRSSILAAARELFLQDSHTLPSAARIAEAAGLAKGTVYLYFRTKEEIFVALLNEDFAGLFDAVARALKDQAPNAESLATTLIGNFIHYLDAHPELLRLDAMAYSVLEQNLGEAQLRGFKLELTHRLVSTGALIDTALNLPEGRGATLLLRTYALTRGLWQSLDYPPALRALLADPAFAPIRPDFRTELIAALNEYWRGALAG